VSTASEEPRRLKSRARIAVAMTADGGPSSPTDDEGLSGDDTPSASRPTDQPRETADGRPADEDGQPTDGDGRDGRNREGTSAGADEQTSSPGNTGSKEESRAPSPVAGSDEERSILARVWHAETGPLFFLREVGTSAAAVLVVGLLLFGVSGVWPPMVAVESGSMEPHMQKGDLVFITEPGRYTPDAAYGSTGVVTSETGDDIGYRTFGGPGSVIVYDDPSRGGPPIIHRALFYVEAGENWYGRTDPEFVSADSCGELRNCPAPHAGFITKGDANSRYDQASNIAEPVKPSWITGIARVRIPYLGWVRLGLAGVVHTGVIETTTIDPGPQLDPERRPARGDRLHDGFAASDGTGTRGTVASRASVRMQPV
jgi:signal peptidase